MLCLTLTLCLTATAAVQQGSFDVSRLVIGQPAIVVDVETSAFKGDIRRLAWKPDGTALYVQSVEGKPPREQTFQYAIDVAGGAITRLDQEPDWAGQYWAVKQDRVAPGIPSLVIDASQRLEKIKSGTGASGVLDRQSSPDAVASGSPNMENLANGMHGNQDANVVRLSLAGEEIAVWVNERPIPGMRFSWGPSGSGALVHLGEHGELLFLDQHRHRLRVPAVKDAFLPAWSVDGDRLAYVQRTGRKRVAIAWLTIGR